MPTTNFKRSVESFLRRVGEGNINITLANPTTISNFAPQPKRYSDIDQIYDYFLYSGQSLFRALDRLTKNEVTGILPNFVKSSSGALSSGEIEITDVERILDPIKLTIAGVVKIAYRIPDSIIQNVLQSVGLRAVSSDYPGYYLKGSKLIAFPTTATNYEAMYIKSVPREVLHSVNADEWSSNFYGLLTDGAVMIAKGDSNESSVERMFMEKLKMNYQYYQIPITNQNNPQIEQK